MYDNQLTIYFPWQGGPYGSLQLLIQPWIYAPGIHYTLEARGSMELKSLPDTFTRDQQWESNTRLFDLAPNALSTRPHAHMGVALNTTLPSLYVQFCVGIKCVISTAFAFVQKAKRPKMTEMPHAYNVHVT